VPLGFFVDRADLLASSWDLSGALINGINQKMGTANNTVQTAAPTTNSTGRTLAAEAPRVKINLAYSQAMPDMTYHETLDMMISKSPDNGIDRDSAIGTGGKSELHLASAMLTQSMQSFSSRATQEEPSTKYRSILTTVEHKYYVWTLTQEFLALGVYADHT